MKKVVFLSVFGALLPLLPARAVVLEQKWKAGQQLSYTTTLSGTAKIQAPAGANFPLAGIPLEIPVRGTGLVQLQTISVDEAGIGTLTVRVPQFNLSGQAFGQTGQIVLQGATSKITIAGSPIKLGDGTNPLAQPQYSYQISSQGRFVGFKPLKAATAPAPTAPVDPAQVIDRTAAMAASIVSALPTLWPGRDVQVGETWKTQIVLPNAPTTDAAQTPQAPLGTWNLTLKDAETIEGKELQRVGVAGRIAFDSNQLKTPNAMNGASANAKQDVRGDLWFDPAAGQIVRANLTLGVQAEGGRSEAEKAHMNFVGTLQLDLKNGN